MELAPTMQRVHRIRTSASRRLVSTPPGKRKALPPRDKVAQTLFLVPRPGSILHWANLMLSWALAPATETRKEARMSLLAIALDTTTRKEATTFTSVPGVRKRTNPARFALAVHKPLPISLESRIEIGRASCRERV